MNKYIKDGLGVAGIVFGVAVGWAAIGMSGAYSKSIEPSSYRSFSVSAEGEEVAVPAVAEFSFSVITEGGKDLAALRDENAKKVNGAIEFIKSNEVDAKDIKTSSYQVTPRYETSDCYSVYSSGRTCPPPQIVGYTVTSSSAVKVRDFSKVGELLSGVVENGANSVSGLSFKIDDRTVVEGKARDKAIAKAMDQAKSISSAAGFKVGKLISINDSRYYPVYGATSYSKDSVLGMGGIEAAPSPVIEPGSETVKVTVTMTYEIR